jgi:streptogramin lyase
MGSGVRSSAIVRAALTASAALTLASGMLVAPAFAAPTINEYLLSPGNLQPSAIVTGPDGNLWFGELGGPNGVGVSSPSGAESRFTTGFTGVTQGVALGPDENLWFTEPKANAIVRETPLGVATVFAVANEPTAIAAGPDGNLWFTETGGAGAIGRICPETGEVATFPTPSNGSKPLGIAAGPDGNLWFTESGGNGAIGRIEPESGAIAEFSVGLTPKNKPTGITQGPDEALWFTEFGGTATIGRITTAGAITGYTTGLPSNSQPQSIVSADDGVLYFTEQGGTGAIGTITTGGTITQDTTGLTASNKPEGITTGPEGNVWFTELGGTAKVGVVTVAPGVQSTLASNVREHAATLEATISDNAQATEYVFEWGTTTAYGHTTVIASAGSGSAAKTVSTALEGLSPGTVYHFRVVATNASGTTEGADATFATPVAPAAVTAAATAVTSSSATLNGSVNPEGWATSYDFEWGTTAGYGHRTPAAETSAGAGTGALAEDGALTSLTPATTYHFRVFASNCGGCAEGTAYGADTTFTTAAALSPGTTTGPATTTPASGAGTPAAPATAGSLSPPALARTAVAGVLSGRVWMIPPGGTAPEPLAGSSDIPVGSMVDATEGTIRITTARNSAGVGQSAEVWGSRFVLLQDATGMTTLRLASHPVCAGGRARRGGLTFGARAPRQSPAPAVGLWAHDHHGHFSTRGLNSVATVRGTYWGTFETCAGTLTVVRSGRVTVRDLERGRTILVTAGHSYLARP